MTLTLVRQSRSAPFCAGVFPRAPDLGKVLDDRQRRNSVADDTGLYQGSCGDPGWDRPGGGGPAANDSPVSPFDPDAVRYGPGGRRGGAELIGTPGRSVADRPLIKRQAGMSEHDRAAGSAGGA